MKKRTLIAGFVLAATLTFSAPVDNFDGSLGADVVSAASGSTSTPSKPSTPSKSTSSSKSSSSKSSSKSSSAKSSLLKLGSRGSAVKTLQKNLNKNGAKLTVDGIFGKKTQAAVKSYQTKNGLTVDGIVGPMTSARLNPTTVKLGSAGAQVKLLQMDLNKAGAKLSVDGIFGKKTLAAVKSFQTKNGLKADGIVGPLTHGKIKTTIVTPAKPGTSKPDTVTAASTNVSSIEVFKKSISKDGKWIIATSKNLTSKDALVLEGTFKNGSKTERNIALYNQDTSGKVSARYTLTAPKLTVLSPNARISNGTFVGDVYVNAAGFNLAGATIKGNLYFETEALKDAFKIGTGKVTGTIGVKATGTKPGEQPGTGETDGNSGASENPDNEKPPVDEVTAASIVDDIKVFEKSIGKDGKWIIATTKDLTSTNNLVLDGDFKNGKKNEDGTDAIQRKIALYTQDENKKVLDEFTLKAPKITIKSANARIQNGTFEGNVHVDRDNFLLSGTTVKGNVYVNQPNFKLAGDAIIEGNVYFASEELKNAFVQPEGTTIKGELIVVDALATASTEVQDITVFENSIGKDGRWIIATTKDLVSDKELVLDGEFTYKDKVQRKIALYSQDADKNITESFRLTAPKLTIKSPNAKIQGGTFKGDLYVTVPNFQLVDARVIGNIYFTTQEAKDTFKATNSSYRNPILTEVDAVATASLVRTEDALVSAMSTADKGGKWIIAILNDITTKKELVLDGTFKNTKNPPVQMRKLALYSQDENHKTTRKFTLTAPKLTILSPDANISKGTFKGDVYVSAPNFKLVDAKVDGNVYFTTQEAKDTFTMDATSSITGSKILTQLDADVVSTATQNVVRDIAGLEKGISANGTWITAILNDITTTKDLVMDGTFSNTKNPPVQMRKLALYSQDSAHKVTRSFTLKANSLTVKSPDAKLQNGIFVGDIYVTAPGFSLVGTKVEGNLYFATQELLDAYKANTAVTGTVTGTTAVKTK